MLPAGPYVAATADGATLYTTSVASGSSVPDGGRERVSERFDPFVASGSSAGGV